MSSVKFQDLMSKIGTEKTSGNYIKSDPFDFADFFKNNFDDFDIEEKQVFHVMFMLIKYRKQVLVNEKFTIKGLSPNNVIGIVIDYVNGVYKPIVPAGNNPPSWVTKSSFSEERIATPYKYLHELNLYEEYYKQKKDKVKFSLPLHKIEITNSKYFGVFDKTAIGYILKEMGVEPIIELDSKEKTISRVLKSGDIAQNLIYYGAPGTGKSYRVNKEFDEKDYNVVRILFHPEYTYSDFIGHIIPRTIAGDIKYEFKRGPFTEVLNNSLNNPNERHVLVIEEVNRGNASAIFGDIFQLLDRKVDGMSEYPIYNEMIGDALDLDVDDIKLPSNMWIVATANTSDQNTFVMDTAFQRRWKMIYCEIDFEIFKKPKNIKYNFEINKNILRAKNWSEFAQNINKFLIDANEQFVAEDKLLGPWFVKETSFDENTIIDKVIRYLWEDVVKYNRESLFNERIRSLLDVRKALSDDKGQLFSSEFEVSISDEKE